MIAFIQDTGTTTGTTVANEAWAALDINAGQRDLYTIQSDGTGLTKLNGQSLDFHSVDALPDGSRAVFAANATDGYSQIYYLAPVASTTKPVQLTITPGDKKDPMLSADGSKIIFVQYNPATLRFDIAVMKSDGSNLYTTPTESDWNVQHPALSPDGSKIVVEMWNANQGVHAIFIVNADGSNANRLTNLFRDEYPAFSPDGKQVVFSSAIAETFSQLIRMAPA